MNDEMDTLLRRYLDGELPPAQESDMLHRIADDDEARTLLRFELQMRDVWSGAPEVPTGFADRTMAAIEDAETEPDPATLPFDRIAERVWTWLVEPHPLQVRPGLVAVAVLLIGAATIGWPTSRQPAPQTTSAREPLTTAATQNQNEVVWTRFMYANDEASSVSVAGDFGEWEPIPLSKKTVDGQTVWTGIVPIPKGEHQYMFVIDGSQWVTDPLAPVQRSDGFGNKNAVLQL